VYHLVPHFIHDKHRANEFTGELMAATMFLDISGFTPMTQTLMQHGKAGAETLSDILNLVFQPVITAVYERGGYISGFAGDAFTAIFPQQEDSHEHAMAMCLASQTIKETFAIHGLQQTPFGDFPLVVKMGLSHGYVEWGIIGDEKHRTYFFRGMGIDGCAGAEHHCRKGDIVLDHSLQMLLPSNAIMVSPINDHYDKLNAFNLDVTMPKYPIPSPYSTLPVSFFHERLLKAKYQGEFKNVASVFISFKGVTNLEELNVFTTQVINSVDRFGGYFNRLDFGDKGGNILISFGAPIAYENTVERTLNFTSELQESLADSADLPNLSWRAGITCGSMYAGIVGIPLRCEYTTLGNSVNFSARLMMKAGWGQVLVAEDITDQSTFKFEHVGDFPYKGFSKPIPTYMFSGKKSVEEKVFDKVMIGRQQELKRLIEAAQPIFEGKFAGVAYIYGEPGIGKSHLSFELSKALAERGEVRWFVGQVDQILQRAFNPFSYFMKRYFNQVPGDSHEKNKATFKKGFNQLIDKLQILDKTSIVAPHLLSELKRIDSILGSLVGLRWDGSLYEMLDASTRHQNVLFAIKTLLLAESHVSPIVFELEDLHWLDESSHEALTILSRNISGYPIFIVVTSRYADDGSKPTLTLSDETPMETIDLNVLSESDLRLLAEVTLGNKIYDDLHQILLKRTQGNPFYAQQMLYYFQENGLIENKYIQGRKFLTVKETAIRELPSSINAILIARIDRLPQPVKDVVKAASVLGREFEDRIIAHMLQSDVTLEVKVGIQEQIWSEAGL